MWFGQEVEAGEAAKVIDYGWVFNYYCEKTGDIFHMNT